MGGPWLPLDLLLRLQDQGLVGPLCCFWLQEGVEGGRNGETQRKMVEMEGRGWESAMEEKKVRYTMQVWRTGSPLH